MVELTPELLTGSFIIVFVFYLIAFAFQVYMLYLNWKQSKVKNKMEDLLVEVKAIRKELNKKNTKSKKKK